MFSPSCPLLLEPQEKSSPCSERRNECSPPQARREILTPAIERQARGCGMPARVNEGVNPTPYVYVCWCVQYVSMYVSMYVLFVCLYVRTYVPYAGKREAGQRLRDACKGERKGWISKTPYVYVCLWVMYVFMHLFYVCMYVCILTPASERQAREFFRVC